MSEAVSGWRVQANEDGSRIDVIPPQNEVIPGPISLRWNLETRRVVLTDGSGSAWSLPLDPLD